MAYGDAGYISHHRDNERVASMLRSITQDGCLIFDETTIQTIFVKKEVDGKDIGKICSDLIMTIAGSLQMGEDENLEKNELDSVEELIVILLLDYLDGINPNDDFIWQIKWLTTGIPLLANKINTLPGTGKVASMASLKKPDKTNKDEIEDWWK